ncbi:ring-hydroxylating oxygenase subunit alpha (plasmid) [Haloferax mediterranei ATCC 33500]|uniref:Dioxygenase n=1 Tax=Haloferax mediterranei (strain ATCC 33500 / DSM 1411 / JCM 8866 / NBRC 14739 / NCIMB 2177 / R-4) TaxID=523841 RepID=I3R9R3_HALMT|nr:Rieske 2Fe-2S domain-containing protein [Haloferax mediterranei]AFK20973.1 putative dioxygenase alpha subunit YeaW / large terminal subunit of phenylpropionate dioxygenase [Haloferax mediterranei ATCC 33500]AHZ24163.1 dioxygenase [Haloferax mediterranei ATCC 33500]EMA05240.1 putative dioxygenase alpha subunit YeaW / large terminal subunit of phenylpropionate dioxygenase [Haloferax mediterranei ATCC 33500]MDX5989956.1 Rieske 2Fe-2S domain-containing protein [Haloferax mediterranei ATCC 33500]
MVSGGTNVGTSSQTQTVIEEVGNIRETGTIPSRIHNDNEIHELELERVFSDTWVFVGHESEIPEPGDYAKRYIGDSPFIFVRDDTGEVRVLFDSCQHRGTTVVRAEQGNTSYFRCPYHNWTYKNTGELVGVPHKEQFFKELDTCEHALDSAPQVDSYEGLVFASLSATAPSLDEYLGDFKWYLDLHLKFAEGGMEVVGEPIRWEIDTNWKIGADNFTGDSYHTLATHKSAMDLDIFPPELSAVGAERTPVDVTECSGHSCMLAYLENQEFAGGYPEDIFTETHLSESELRLAKRLVSSVGTVFPNFSFLQMNLNADPENREVTAFLNIRKWQPLGPKKTQVWNWILVPRDSSEEFKQRAYDTGISTFSVAGNFEVDDFAVWDGIAEAAGSTFGKKIGRRSNFQMGVGEMGDATNISDEWPGPGAVYDTNFEDGTMQTFYQSWYRSMTGRPIDSATEDVNE